MSTGTTVITNDFEASRTRTLHIVYGLHALGLAIGAFGAASVVGSFLFGWPSIIAVIVSYMYRGDVRGTWLESHFDWAIRTFWLALAFAVAASANLPVIVLSLFWRRFNTAGAVCGLATGLVSSLVLIAMSPSIMRADAIFPLENPGILSIPLGFLGAVLGTLLTREPAAEQKFTELSVRANTGLGAEKAVSH